ncbi:3-deoxy-D-manno-octulosonic acid kinase [Halospina sp. K52047b]|nr:3-deoxy-D-manno-octulosonic acid kinase [Halospina sp. K52047b]
MREPTTAKGVHCVTGGHAVFQVNEPWSAVFEPGWFEPEWWGEAAEPVAAGGRGGAWFVSGASLAMVLRYYNRGGLVARVSSNAYLYTGLARTRSVAEFNLLKALYDQGLPVPRPVASAVWRYGFLHYRAAILVERLADTRSLGEQASALSDAWWYRVGASIRQFHDYGVDHPDLNCFNILLSQEKVYLIDFDKGVIRSPSVRSKWPDRNLKRLHRSLMKLEGVSPSRLSEGWNALLAGYGKGT